MRGRAVPGRRWARAIAQRVSRTRRPGGQHGVGAPARAVSCGGLVSKRGVDARVRAPRARTGVLPRVVPKHPEAGVAGGVGPREACRPGARGRGVIGDSKEAGGDDRLTPVNQLAGTPPGVSPRITLVRRDLDPGALVDSCQPVGRSARRSSPRAAVVSGAILGPSALVDSCQPPRVRYCPLPWPLTRVIHPGVRSPARPAW